MFYLSEATDGDMAIWRDDGPDPNKYYLDTIVKYECTSSRFYTEIERSQLTSIIKKSKDRDFLIGFAAIEEL